jgi:hypothetical protein
MRARRSSRFGAPTANEGAARFMIEAAASAAQPGGELTTAKDVESPNDVDQHQQGHPGGDQRGARADGLYAAA